MGILGLLIPVSLVMGVVGLAAFFWAARHHQFDDPEGDARRILDIESDDRPGPR